MTDPGSPLDVDARAQGFTVLNADPQVGGRFSVLGAFGLAPSALSGSPVKTLLDDSRIEKESFLADAQPVLDTAYLLATQSAQYIGFTDAQSDMPGLSDWIEQLIAESTGKNSVGRLPIATENAVNAAIGGAFTVSYCGNETDLVVEGALGAHFIFWEWVTALLGLALKIDPFNQPNVTEAKEQTSACLAEWKNELPELRPRQVDAGVEIFGEGQSLTDALATFIEDVKEGGYIAIMAYLDRRDDKKIAELRSISGSQISTTNIFWLGSTIPALHGTVS